MLKGLLLFWRNSGKSLSLLNHSSSNPIITTHYSLNFSTTPLAWQALSTLHTTHSTSKLIITTHYSLLTQLLNFSTSQLLNHAGGVASFLNFSTSKLLNHAFGVASSLHFHLRGLFAIQIPLIFLVRDFGAAVQFSIAVFIDIRLQVAEIAGVPFKYLGYGGALS